MTHLKKLIVAAMAVVTAVALCVPAVAFAGSITITRDKTYDPGASSADRTYTAYKVFDADTSLSGSNSQDDKQPTYTANGPIAYSMATNSPWVAVLWDTTNNTPTTGQNWFKVALAADGSKYVVTPAKTLSDSDAADIAAFLKANKPASATGVSITPGTATTVDDGYYYIEASDGATNATLVTTDVKIVEKNTYLTTKKETEETSYSIGDIIDYTATVDVPADASLTDPIILHDEMNSVLAFDANSVEATMDGAAFTDFSLVTSPTDNCTFEISIPVTTEIRGKSIVFTYSAELTSAAIDPDTGFINKLFGEKNGYTTKPDEPQVYTFDFDFVKVFDDEEDETLTATFNLYTSDEYAKMTDDDEATTASAIAFKKSGDNYVKADSDDTGTITDITMTNGIVVNFQGFEEGDYILVETGTSTGYNLLDAPVTITITDTSNADLSEISHTVSPVNALGQVEVENHQGTVLPSTGGIGTTIFYVIGVILVIGAGVVLVTKRRVAAARKDEELI